MYNVVLFLHSWMRWAVLVTAVLTLLKAAAGHRQHRPWTAADDGAMQRFVIAVDIQTLLGLLLYVALSPVTAAAFEDFGAAMRNGPLRFWAVEHLTGMIVAVVLAHVGRVLVKRATDAATRHRRALTFTGLALLVMLISIPWPGLPNGRALFRLAIQ